MLAHGEVAAYLLDRRLIGPATIVDGDLAVVDVSRRNHNFKVINEQGLSYLLKQGVGDPGVAPVTHEAFVYRLLHSSSGTELQRYLPGYYGYDARRAVLILELLDGARSLERLPPSDWLLPTSLAARLGTALSCLHRRGREFAGTGQPETLPARLPWALFLDRPGLDLLREASNANLHLIRIIQSVPEFRRAFDELRQGWRFDTLIHNDVKWDNCLVFAAPGARRTTRLKLIDWEFAGIGDPCWDAGAVFSSYLSFWLLSIPITGAEPPERLLDLTRYPLERMQPAMQAYWSAYVRGMELDEATADEWLTRAVKYSAARLVQSAFEQAQTSTSLSNDVICLLQLALNIALRPSEALGPLLGVASGPRAIA